MIKYILNKNNKNLILLVHGFTGGKDTWIEKGGKRIPKYLKKNKEITSNFDIAYFEYFTEWSAKIEQIKWFCAIIGSKKRKFKQNLSIDDIKDILFSHLEIVFKKYDKVIIIAHSMGGLISKAAILKLIENDNNKIALFLSLSVPHNGSKLADLGKLILNNPNLKDLAPLSDIIDEITRKWLNQSMDESLPETIYYQGKNDTIVSQQSSVGYEARKIQVVYSDDDHSSILSPNSADSVVMASITEAILETLKKKGSTKRPQISADISDESIKTLTDKIGNRLGIIAPEFENYNYTKDRIPHLSVNISNRVDTIRTILSESDKKWIAIHGMYDTGKTQLSVLILRYLALDTIWISFKDCDEKSILRKLFASFEAKSLEDLDDKINVLSTENKTLIVLDDLPKFGIDTTVDNVFNTFISTCLQKDIKILSTSNHVLASSIKSVHNENVYERQIPLLNEAECKEVILTYPDSFDFPHKDLLHTITKGYPIYLQVVCRYLQNNAWIIEEDQLLDFFSGKLFTDLTDETLIKFVAKVEDEQTRELLYRLNIVITNITDKEIKVVSECNPYIIRPLEKIVPIIGSWLQRDRDNYVISPLFKRLGTANLPESIISKINYELGKLILSKGILSQFDVQHVIKYFTEAKRYNNAGFVVLTFLQHCLSQPNLFFDWNFELYTWYYTPIPKQIHLALRLLIRSLQLNLECTRPTENQDNLDFLRKDLVTLVDEALIEKVDIYLPAMVLFSSYLKEDSELAIKYFSYYINSYTYKELPEKANIELGEIMELDNVIWLLLFNVADMVSLNQWFNNVRSMDKSINELDGEQAFFMSEKLFNNFIDNEKSLQYPNWNTLVELFDQIFTKATELNIETLKAFALKKQILILSEKLNDVLEAESLYLQKKDTLKEKRSVFLVTDELGRQFYYKKNNEKAKEYLLQISDFKIENYLTVKTDTYLTLAKIVSPVDAKEAHSYMSEGLEFITDNIFIDEISYIQFIGEFATSLLLLGEPNESLIKFIDGYELLLDSFEENNIYINTQIRYGNAIGYLVYLIESGFPPGDGYITPYIGFITNNNNLADLYFPEKLLINVFNIIRFFETINDKEKAEYWAYKIFELKEKHGMRIFHKMLLPLSGYMIVNNQFEPALEQSIEIIRLTNEMLLMDTEQISNQNEKELMISIQSQEALQKKDPEFELIIMTLNPILIQLLTKYLENQIDVVELVKTYTNLLAKYSSNFGNNELLTQLNYILNHFPHNETESKELLDYVQKVNPNIFGHLQVMTLLICSTQMNSKTAIATHFLMKLTFDLYKGSVNNFILIPFLLGFWNTKLAQEPKLFKNPTKFFENLQKIPELKITLQAKAIFSLAAEQLFYNLKADDKLWLKEYTEEYD